MDGFVIFGASAFGSYIKNKLENDYDVNVVAYLDHDPVLVGTCKDGIPIRLPQECSHKKTVIFALWMIDKCRDIIPELKACGYKDFLCLKGGRLCKICDEGYERTEYRIGKDKPVLQYLEMHVTDHCNLNCRGCMHFSNMHAKEFASLEQFEKDMFRIRDVFDTVIRIRLMGGEPLLNPELDQFMDIARKTFPYADVHIATNGLLLTRVSDTVVDSAKKNDISFDITAYPPVVSHIGEIEEFCEKNNLRYGIGSDLSEFRKTLSIRSDNDVNKSTQICMAASCHFLRNGKLYKCAIPAMVDDFNREFGLNFVSNDTVDLYSEDFDPWKAIEILDNPIDFCKNCPDHESFQKWMVRASGWKKSDWFAEMEEE